MIDVYVLIFGLTLLVLGLSAGAIKNLWHISEPVVAVTVGVIAGPVTGLLQPPADGAYRLLAHLMEFTLVVALIDVALTLPRDYLQKSWRVLAALLGVALPLMAVVTLLLAWWLLPVTFWQAAVIGAVLAPTDPVVASAVVSGKLAGEKLADPIRHALIAESASNDALALPLVALAIGLLPATSSFDLAGWVVHALLRGVALSVVIGWVAGYATAWLMARVHASTVADRASLVTVSVTLGLTLMAGTNLLGSDGLLAAFVAGLVINCRLPEKLAQSKREMHGTLRRFVELPAFLAFGILIPWRSWEPHWLALLMFSLLALMLRRPLPILLLRRRLPMLAGRLDALFFGWFGPMGIGALFYALMVVEQTGLQSIWNISSFVVVISVLSHGSTATHFTSSFVKKNGSEAGS